MAKVYPFRALRPKRGVAAQVAAVPYDVVTRGEARELARDNAVSFLHVTKPEIDLPDTVDVHAEEVYAAGRKALDDLVKNGTLVRDDQPCFYVYQLQMGEHVQTGFVLLASVRQYDQNIVRKHEHTRPDKEDDRVAHMAALGAQSGIVSMCHRDSEALKAITAKAAAGAPTCDFNAPDGVAHRVWVVQGADDVATVRAAFEEVGPLYIADGHHRSAAASRVSASLRAKGDTSESADGFLAVSFPASEVAIMDYNRVVRDLNGRNADEFLAAVGERLGVTEGRPSPIAKKQFGMYLAGRWYSLTTRPGTYDPADPVERLDVSILQKQVLAPVLGIEDPRRDTRIEFVGGIRGEAELVKKVDHMGFAVAFRLHPTAIEDLLAIADAEQVMPPKSTWFEPKLRDGLFVHQL